jgi:NAD(P)-dependent dehydrogenase (short-subunit alcohol dehydrogenase family)
MKNIIVITGASSGFGALAARALAIAGHTVYPSSQSRTGSEVGSVDLYLQADSPGKDKEANWLRWSTRLSSTVSRRRAIARGHFRCSR